MRLILTILLIGLFKADAQMVINASAPYRPLLTGFPVNDYPIVSAAYSLRKLNKDYTGPAIRVRKDTTGQPEQDINFSGNDLDTTSLKNFLNARSGFVVTWYDQSGNARNATMPTQAQQPRIANLGVIERRNGDLSIRFDGSNDYLENNTNGFAVNNVSHYAISSRANDANALRIIYSTGILATLNGFGFTYAASQNTILQQIRNLNVSTQEIGFYTNTLNVNSLIFGIATSSIDYTYYNGGNEQTISHTRSNVTSTGRIILGSRRSELGAYGFYLNGTITEIVFWDGNQTNNRTAIENNANNYWSIY